MTFYVSPKTEQKLIKKHNVKADEIGECFANSSGVYLNDTRYQHKTNPPTQWFIAETDQGRLLKIIFIFNQEEKKIVIKSAYAPNEKEKEIYFQWQI